jgi:hypothetical protein
MGNNMHQSANNESFKKGEFKWGGLRANGFTKGEPECGGDGKQTNHGKSIPIA